VELFLRENIKRTIGNCRDKIFLGPVGVTRTNEF
jgi:hypothetical protein